MSDQNGRHGIERQPLRYEDVFVDMGRVGRLLSDKAHWCQRSYARTLNGTIGKWWAPGASAWCLRGAIMRCYGTDSVGQEAMWLLERAVHAKFDMRVTEWQDDKKRTFEEVHEFIKQAGL